MRRAILALLFLAGPSAVAAQDGIAEDRRRLAQAKLASMAAQARATELARAAAVERDAAERARAEERAVAARVARAAADLSAAAARVRIVDALLARRRDELGTQETPVARLLGALGTLGRRPTIVAVAQPGSVDDLVHLRAVLGSVLPVVRARTAGLRQELAATRTLRADAALAAKALADSRGTLARERQALAAVRASHEGRADTLRRQALAASDQAVAQGEAARDLVDRMDQAGDAAQVGTALARLATPPGGAANGRGDAPYRLPVVGRLVTGYGELSANGVRARGLTFAVGPGESAVAPAAGRVLFARPFRDYGTVVILDHGDGWRSAVIGLGSSAVQVGDAVAAGQRIGAAGGGEPRVTVELYRRGRPIDIGALLP
jgi:septal ring factor EnvC (AmiA/AmiB activator)